MYFVLHVIDVFQHRDKGKLHDGEGGYVMENCTFSNVQSTLSKSCK